MSGGNTGTWVETLYTSTGVGTAKNTFAVESQINDVAGMGVQARIPKDFWLPNNAQIGRGIRIKAAGIVSSTGTPTYTLTCRLGAQGNTTTAAILQTPAMTTVSGAANGFWEFEGDFILTAIGGVGANSSGRGIGHVLSGASAFATSIYPLFGGGASPGSISNLDTSVDNFVNFNANCSTSNVANQIQLLKLLVKGLN
jgi:hypothetical protein